MALPALSDGVAWSVEIRDVASGATLAWHAAERVLPTASVGKMFLLAATAVAIESGTLDPHEPLTRARDDDVADSGIWQHLSTPTLPVTDVCTLIGSVSDNLATNVLLPRIGLDASHVAADLLDARDSRLLDKVRDHRGSEDPQTLSVGSARDLAGAAVAIEVGTSLGASASRRVRSWLGTSVDLSMVASAFGLDPLAHSAPDAEIRLWNKTGTDAGILADVGVVSTAGDALAYAVVAGWDHQTQPDLRDDVLADMHAVGVRIRERLAA
ncbi:UNVERIFIED_CONTAM: hypothetical protein LK11_38230 [Mumia flava]